MNPRRPLFYIVKETIKKLDREDLASLPFTEVRQLLCERGLEHPRIKTERFAAMILSIAKGNTTDEDLTWH